MRALLPGMSPAVTPRGHSCRAGRSCGPVTDRLHAGPGCICEQQHRRHHPNPGPQWRPTGVAATYAAGTGGGINIFTPEGKCSDHLQWRAIDPSGNVVSTLTKACQGDTWNIEPKGK